MPYFCVEKLHRALNTRGKSLNGAKVLVLGVAYKADIDDLRESPALKVIRLLRAHGAEVDYHDPYCPELPEFGLSSVDLDEYRALVRLRRGDHRHRALGARLPHRRPRGRPRGRLPQRHGRHPERRQRLETVRGETRS